MELQKLRYFRIVAELQHMTRAAETISIAQPALSQAIRSLERELGVPLFEKRGRNIVLTEYGVYLKKRLDAILPEIDSLSTEMDRLKDASTKTVKLNILAASTFVIGCIVRYREKNPDAVFEFEQNARQHDADIVITTNGSEGHSEKTPVMRETRCEQIYLAVPRTSPYALRNAIALSEMREESFVLLSGSRLFGALCNRLCADAGFYPKILFESDAPTAVQNIISTGSGVAFWPAYSWGAPDLGKVALIPIEKPDCRRDLTLELYLRTPRSLYAEDFYRFLLQELGV